MKANLIRLIIVAPVVVFVLFVIHQEQSKTPSSRVLGSSVVFTVGDSGIACNTRTLLNDPQTGQQTEIDGTNVRGTPLGATVTYKTDCQNTGSQVLNNISLTNNLSGQNQNYLTYNATNDSGCNYQNNIFSCSIDSLAVGSSFSRSFTVTVALEVPSVVVVTNNTQLSAGQGLSGNTLNDFSIFPRPLCNSLGPAQDPIIVVENTPITLTASGTVYDNSAPIYTLSFGDGTADATGTNSNFVHTFQRVSGESESTYFTYLRVSDSLGNETGDAANCSADCSKIIKVIGPLATKYCTCSNGSPSCSASSGTTTCTSDATCSSSCSFYCDQSAGSATPSTGKSPLNVALSETAGGTPSLPLTFKIYDGAILLKQESSSSKTLTATVSLTNSTQSVETHLIITNITDSTGKTTANNCVNAIAVQPAGTGVSGHYECQSNRCVYSAIAGQTTCSNDAQCLQSGQPISCTLAAVPAAGAAPINTNLTVTCQGGTPPYVSYDFTLGDGGRQTSTVPTINHTYQLVGTYTPSVTGTDSQNQVSPAARAQVLASSTSAVISDFHLECNVTTKACEAVEGVGVNGCNLNSDCAAPSGPSHSVCNKVRKTCESYYGFGPSSCTSNTGCQGLRNGFTLPTILTVLLGSALLVGGLVLIIKRA